MFQRYLTETGLLYHIVDTKSPKWKKFEKIPARFEDHFNDTMKDEEKKIAQNDLLRRRKGSHPAMKAHGKGKGAGRQSQPPPAPPEQSEKRIEKICEDLEAKTVEEFLKEKFGSPIGTEIFEKLRKEQDVDTDDKGVTLKKLASCIHQEWGELDDKWHDELDGKLSRKHAEEEEGAKEEPAEDLAAPTKEEPPTPKVIGI